MKIVTGKRIPHHHLNKLIASITAKDARRQLPGKSRPQKKPERNVKKILIVLFIILFITGLLFFLLGNLLIMMQSSRISHTPENLPKCHAALVLGCSPTFRNRDNLFFLARMDAAAKVYRSGRVKKLLLSGDNGRKGYNEPEAMRQALIARGVPDRDIYCDYAGFSTLDSVIRAESVFGQRKFIIISQPFHCERALFLARIKGLEVCGFAAEDIIIPSWKIKNRIRESLARPAAILDLLTFRSARFGGEKVDMDIPQQKAD